MKICILAGVYVPYVGGYCRNIHELARRLAENGHEVKVITCNMNGWKETENLDGVSVYRLPSWLLLQGQYPVPKLSRALFRALKGKPDVVVTQTRFFATSFLGAFYAWLSEIPLVHVERGSVHTVMSGKLLPFLVRAYDHTAGHWIVRHAKVNIGVSEACRDFCFHLGGKNGKVIHNGVELESDLRRAVSVR